MHKGASGTTGPVKLVGIAAAEGVAVGPAFVHAAGVPSPGRESIPESMVEDELEKFRRAAEAVAEYLSGMGRRLREAGRGEEAEIFEAHAELAGDPELASGVEERVRGLQSPEAAVLAVGGEYAEMFAAMGNEYMTARADDVLDVTRQMAAGIQDRQAGMEAPKTPSVVLARRLAPSDMARIPKGMALGFVTAEGSTMSHVSIMARSMGLPAVVGVGGALDGASGVQTVAVDGTEGYAVLDPGPETVAEFAGKRARISAGRAALEKFKHVEARTRGGRRVEVSANLGGSVSEARDALGWGAEGVGLFRTEFLFMHRPELPTEEEQYEAYREVAEAFGGRPVVIRTLDVGGDKSLPGVDQPEEENPFLGWRGIRMSLDTPRLFEPQLRAILRAAAHGHLKVMFPMVSRVEELREAKEILVRCQERLESEGAEVGPAEAGVMVETPAAALCAAELAREAAFFSIGTNDLVQYVMAADRGNERLRRGLQSADHPAVLKLIRETCEAAREAGIPVGVCGEAAGEPAMIPKLVELGVTGLSMSPPSIPRAKKILSES